MINDDMNKPKYTCTDYTCNGKCSSCGACCSYILPMSKLEVKEIKRYMKKHKIKEQRHVLTTKVDLTCPFRDEKNKKCLVYEVRPEICRKFMCNHKQEDIAKQKFNFHQRHDVVFMRKEFFGSKEEDTFSEMFRMVLK